MKQKEWRENDKCCVGQNDPAHGTCQDSWKLGSKAIQHQWIENKRNTWKHCACSILGQNGSYKETYHPAQHPLPQDQPPLPLHPPLLGESIEAPREMQGAARCCKGIGLTFSELGSGAGSHGPRTSRVSTADSTFGAEPSGKGPWNGQGTSRRRRGSGRWCKIINGCVAINVRMIVSYW